MNFTVHTQDAPREVADSLLPIFLTFARLVGDKVKLQDGCDLLWDMRVFQATTSEKTLRWYGNVNAHVIWNAENLNYQPVAIPLLEVLQIHILDNGTIIHDSGVCSWTSTILLKFLNRSPMKPGEDEVMIDEIVKALTIEEPLSRDRIRHGNRKIPTIK